MATALRPGGRVVIETMNRDGLQPSLVGERDWIHPGGGRVRDRHSFDPLTGRLSTTRIVKQPDGSIEDHSHSIRVMPVEGIVELLRRAGLGEVAVSEGFDLWGGHVQAPLRPFSLTSNQVCVTGVRSRRP
jgi:hypothetical protein